MNEATARILEFIGRIRPPYARMLRWEIERMPEEDQLDRVTQALAAIRAPALEETERPGSPDENRALIESFEAAVKRLESLRGEPI